MQRTQEDPPWLWYDPVAIEKYFDEIHRKFLSIDLIPLPGVTHQRKRGDQDMLEHEIFEDGEEQIRVSYNVLRRKQITDRIWSSLLNKSFKITDGPTLRHFQRKNVLRPRT